MVRVSKEQLNKDLSENVYKNFIDKIVKLDTGTEGRVFLDELLTDTEFEMLAKRFAAILLLAQGLSTYRVHKMLKMSNSTTVRLRKLLKEGKYNHFTAIVKGKKKDSQLWADLEVIVRCGMPEMGKGRWNWLDDVIDK